MTRQARLTLADFPEIARSLDRKRSGGIDPRDVPFGSSKPLWWRCLKAPDHCWQAAPATRMAGSGCPFCAGKRASSTNRLSTAAPLVAAQWHPTKNGTLTPDDVTRGSDRRVWWRCPKGPDHEWEATIGTRTRDPRALCPFCLGRRVSITQCLATRFPEIAAEWHPKKNGSLTPRDAMPASSKSIWWRCRANPRHIWQARVSSRTNGHGCPACGGQRPGYHGSLAARAPALAKSFHPTKNGGLTPVDVKRWSTKPVSWRCPKGPDHEWQAPPSSRYESRLGCPFCANKRVSVTNSLATRYPAVALEWHPTLNGELTPRDVVFASWKRVWFQCSAGHAWEAKILHRTQRGQGCPFCANKRVSATNSLAACYPAIAFQWHPTLNGELTPHDVVSGSRTQAWFQCSSGHVWKSRIYTRTGRGSGCPHCYTRKHKPVTRPKRYRRVLLPSDFTP
jgi:hypothetical protein